MLKNPETNPYPHKFQITYEDSKFTEEFGHLKSGETAEGQEIRIAGRIYSIRTSSSKLIFYGSSRHLHHHTIHPLPSQAADKLLPKRHPHLGRHRQHRYAPAGHVPGAIGQGGQSFV